MASWKGFWNGVSRFVDGMRDCTRALNGLKDTVQDACDAAQADPVKGPQIEHAKEFMGFTGMPIGAMSTATKVPSAIAKVGKVAEDIGALDFGLTVGKNAYTEISQQKEEAQLQAAARASKEALDKYNSMRDTTADAEQEIDSTAPQSPTGPGPSPNPVGAGVGSGGGSGGYDGRGPSSLNDGALGLGDFNGSSKSLCPIVIDLEGDGIELTPLSESTVFYDINGDGFRNNTGWTAASDALLAYDKNEDNVICDFDEISYVGYKEGAKTDLEGLTAFDTNHDNIFDENDAEFHKFRVWQDLDQDGESDVGELRTLSEAGIESFNLWSDNVVTEEGGNTIYGIGNYTKMGEYGDAQGTTGQFADTAFATSNFGYKEFEDGTKIIRGSDGAKSFVSADDFDTTIDLSDSIYEGYVTGAGNDSLSAGSREDVLLSGEAGDDTITGGDGTDGIPTNDKWRMAA